MRIKSLYIKGFKTFYEKSVINFDSEISTIVGPNGCGKTNLLDAMRWVLGEQNPRLLRLDSMSQVVADGNDNLPKQNYAEVSLLIENNEEDDFVETEIKRKLYRSGESEYYLNGTQCRLKDISDIIMSAGAGSRSFTIIPQGQIDTYITSKPEEKKNLIDEAAGLAIYKSKRAETERKMLLVQDNLERTRDIQLEIGKQKDSLEEQAKKANAYSELVNKFRSLEKLFYKSRYRDLSTKLSKYTDEKKEFSNITHSIEEERNKIKSNISKSNDEYANMVRRIEELNLSLLRTKEDKMGTSSQVNILQKENVLLVEELVRAKDSKRDLRLEVDGLILETEDIDKNYESIEKKLIDANEQISFSTKDNLDDSGVTQDEAKARLLDAVERYSSLKTSHSIIENELSELSVKQADYEAESKKLEDSILGIKKEMTEIKENSFRLQSIRDNCEENKKEETERLLKSNRELKEINEKYFKINSDIESTKSRVKVLENIEATYGWLPEGIRNFVHQLKGKSVDGTVSDFIKSKTGYEKAIESALGEKLKWILINDKKNTIDTIERFKSTCTGRGTFIPMNNNIQAGGSLNINQTMIMDCIECDQDNRPFLASILADTYVSDTILDAIKAREEFPNFNFVTMDGEFFDSNGSISVGSAPDNILQIKDEIKDLNRLKVEHDKDIDLVSIEIKKIEDEIFDINNRIESFDAEIASYSESYEVISEKLSKFNSKLSAETSLRQNMESQAIDLKSNLILKKKKLDDIYDEINLIIEQKNEFEKRFNLLEKAKNISSSQIVLDSKKNEIENLKVSLDEQNNSKKNMGQRINVISLKIERDTSRIIDLEDKIESNSIELRRLSDVFEEFKTKETALVGDIDIAKSKIDEIKRALTKDNIEKQEKDDELENRRAESLNFDSNIQKVDLEIEQLIENVNPEFNNYDIKIVSEDECSQIELLKDNDDLSKSKFNKLQRSIESFGPVNLLAPEEFEKLKERFEFTDSQIKDLDESLNNLQKAINKIDEESETAFMETFNKISSKYDEYIKTLFGGGEGKLILTNPNSLKDTGIEVMLKIGLKKYRTLKSYSGGERALAGIALLLSAYFVKPAPFLLLDEVDAPLDDKNISKFGEMLKEISKKSQVAIITHNKRTMKFSNKLIGITSKLEGLSEVIPVDLSE
ncbi:chromosome segregation protein SMC [bacterium]|nr:chromosome segregation protein SMC [bacterium]MBT4634777.1 chromosome segregation protein SMC [bacterium]